MKKVIITVEVEAEYDEIFKSPSEVAKNVSARITAFLYPGGIKVLKANVTSIEHNNA